MSGYSGLSFDEKFKRYRIITVSADNYYLVTFASDRNIFQFRIDIQHSLIRSECTYEISKVRLNESPTNFTGGNDITIERELRPFMRDYKLETIGI